MTLSGKVAFVTGAGSGFGKAISERFAKEGASVAVCDLNEASAGLVAGEIVERGGTAAPIVVDVADGESFGKAVRATVSRFGGIDILVNNAGYTHDRGPMEAVPEAEYDRVFAVNVKSIFHSTVHVVPELRRRGGGNIINIGSTGAVRPGRNLVWYVASKGAVVAATKAMAMELADDGIRVNVINPFAGTTGLMDKFLGTGAGPQVREAVEAMVPLNRMCDPGDVAHMALFLVSEGSNYLTGQEFHVDGGWLGGWYLRSPGNSRGDRSR